MSPTWSYGTAAAPSARIRAAEDTGLRNLPLHRFAQNQIWYEIIALACELLACDADARLRRCSPPLEPKWLWLRTFAVTGRIVRGGRRLHPPALG